MRSEHDSGEEQERDASKLWAKHSKHYAHLGPAVHTTPVTTAVMHDLLLSLLYTLTS